MDVKILTLCLNYENLEKQKISDCLSVNVRCSCNNHVTSRIRIIKDEEKEGRHFFEAPSTQLFYSSPGVFRFGLDSNSLTVNTFTYSSFDLPTKIDSLWNDKGVGFDSNGECSLISYTFSEKSRNNGILYLFDEPIVIDDVYSPTFNETYFFRNKHDFSCVYGIVSRKYPSLALHFSRLGLEVSQNLLKKNTCDWVKRCSIGALYNNMLDYVSTTRSGLRMYGEI